MTDDIYAKLAAPFAPQEVSWRVGPTTKDKAKGMALAYVDARVVMDRLDAVCGPQGWQNRYSHANGKTVCDIGIKDAISGEWIWKADGAGDSEMEAEKGALSDAFKRAAVRWGIGRYLYETQSPWVEIEQHGNSYSIKDSERAKLHALLGGSKAPVQTQPSPRETIAKITPVEWVNACKSTIDSFRTGRELDEWEALPKTRAALDKLWNDNADLAKNLEAYIGAKRTKLKVPA